MLVDTLARSSNRRDATTPGDDPDRALLCLGFASGCRRSELVGIAIFKDRRQMSHLTNT